MNQIHIEDKTFKLSIPFIEIDEAIASIAKSMDDELGECNPLFICVLNGSFMFAADLMKKLSFNCEISFVKLSSYKGVQSTGQVRSLIGLDENIEGRTVVILEDIVDTGVTVENMLDQLSLLNPLEIKIASLFFKPEVCRRDISIDFVGIEIPNEFVVGYGLDYNGLGRNLKDLYKVIN